MGEDDESSGRFSAPIDEVSEVSGVYSYFLNFCDLLGLTSGNVVGKGVGLFSAVSIQCNFTIGSGFLVLPWAFYESGIVLGVLTTILYTYGQYLTNMQILEVHARANYLGPAQCERMIIGENEHSTPGERASLGVGTVVRGTDDEEDSDDEGEGEESLQGPTWADSGGQKYGIGDQIDMGVLVGVFMGETQMKLFTLLFSFSYFMTMWVWTALFATSWATYVPFGDLGYETSYVIYTFIWMGIHGVWGMMSIEEQSEIQVMMFLLRIVLFLVVMVTVVVPWITDINSFELGDETASYSPASFDQFQIKNWYIIIAALSFSCANVGTVPAVTGSLGDKKDASKVVGYAALVTFICYVGFGTFLSLYFAGYIDVPFSTNWISFSGFSDAISSTPVYAVAITGFVVIFPSLDVMSSYAMQVQIVCDNTLYLLVGSAGTTAMKRDNRYLYYVSRLLTAWVPALCALITDNLGLLVVYSGAIFVIFQYTYPSYLSYISKKMMKELKKPTETEFTFLHDEVLAKVMVALSIGITIMLVLSLAISGVPVELE